MQRLLCTDYAYVAQALLCDLLLFLRLRELNDSHSCNYKVTLLKRILRDVPSTLISPNVTQAEETVDLHSAISGLLAQLK